MNLSCSLPTRRQLLAAALSGALAPRARADGAPLTVFAAASLRDALDDVAHAFAASSGITARISYAASSQLARQIAAGAPADLFISADLEWMDWLETEKVIDPDSRRLLLGNSLVLITRSGSSDQPVRLERGVDIASLVAGSRLVIAEPSSVPAGRYARQALEYLGQWSAVENRLVFGANVRAALALVARGEVGFGIVYATDAMAEPRVRIISRFDAASHMPILYPIARTRRGSGQGDAFLRFLTTPSVRHLFERRGFRYLLHHPA